MDPIKFNAASAQPPTATQMNHNRGHSPFVKNEIRFHLGGQYLTNFTDEGIADFLKANAPKGVKLDAGDVKLFVQRVAENAEAAKGITFNLADPDLKLSKGDGIDGDKWKAAFSLVLNKEGHSTPEVAFVDVAKVEFGAAEVAFEKPAAEKPAAEKPAAEKPAAEKPAAEKPAAEKPAAEKPAAEKPAAEKPAAEKPAIEPKPGDVVVKPSEELGKPEEAAKNHPPPTIDAFKKLKPDEQKIALVSMNVEQQATYLKELSHEQLKALQTSIAGTIKEIEQTSEHVAYKKEYGPKYTALKEKVDAQVTATAPKPDAGEPAKEPTQQPAKPAEDPAAEKPKVDGPTTAAPVDDAGAAQGQTVTKDGEAMKIDGNVVTYSNFADLTSAQQFRILMRTDEVHVEKLLRTLKAKPHRHKLSEIKSMASSIITGYHQKVNSASHQASLHSIEGYSQTNFSAPIHQPESYSHSEYNRAQLIVNIINKIEQEIAAEEGGATTQAGQQNQTVKSGGREYTLQPGETLYTVTPGQTARQIANDFYKRDKSEGEFEADEIFKHKFNKVLLENMLKRTDKPYDEKFDPDKGDPLQIILPIRPTGNPLAGVKPRKEEPVQPNAPLTEDKSKPGDTAPKPETPPAQAPKKPAE